MAIVLGIVVVVAAVACAWLASARARLATRLAAAEAETAELADRLAATAAERDALDAARGEAAAAAARAESEAAATARRADDLAARLAAAEAEAEAARAAAAAAAARGADGDGLWHLLLAHVARRWGAMVGVPPEGRAVVAGPPADQLAEALAREIERLREEVGVDVEMVASAADPDTGRLGDDPEDLVPALLAALELLGVLASTAQRVTVSLGGELVLTGEGWYDPAGELEAVSERAAAAGATLGPVRTDDEAERVEIVVRPRGG